MPKQLKEFKFSSAGRKYDWDQCANGPVQFVKGVDFQTSLSNFRCQAYTNAARRKMRAKAHFHQDKKSVIVQFFPLDPSSKKVSKVSKGGNKRAKAAK